MKNNKTVYLVTLALLCALIALFGFTPLGMLNLGIVYVTLLCLPVIVGTLTTGLQGGIILSLCFGTVSLITGLNAPSALVQPILSNNILYVILLCYVPRILIPIVTHLTHKALKNKSENLAYILSPILGSFTNTVFYMGGMLLFYVIIGIDSTPILTAISSVILLASTCEAMVAAIATLPIMKALQKTNLLKKIQK